MRLRLIARSAEIEISDPIGREHAQHVIPFGRQVDPPPGGRGRDEEQGLARDEGDVVIGEGGEEFGHTRLAWLEVP